MYISKKILNWHRYNIQLLPQTISFDFTSVKIFSCYRYITRMPAPTSIVPQAHSVNTDSPSNSKVQSVAGNRVNTEGYNLPASQAVTLTRNMRHEILIIPASTVPSFGSTFNIDIKEKNILFHNLTLQFVTGPVVGTNLVGTFNPCWYFMTGFGNK